MVKLFKNGQKSFLFYFIYFVFRDTISMLSTCINRINLCPIPKCSLQTLGINCITAYALEPGKIMNQKRNKKMGIQIMPGTADNWFDVFAIRSCSCWEFFWMLHCLTDLAGNESCVKGKRRKHTFSLCPEHCSDWVWVIVFCCCF